MTGQVTVSSTRFAEYVRHPANLVFPNIEFRFGGDTKGLMNNLDYIEGMGIKVILSHNT